MLQKNNKVIPHQYKSILKTLTNCLHRPLLSRENALFFCILCRRGGLPSSENGLYVFLFFMLLIVINMLLVCYDYLDGSDFLLRFFEIFADLTKVIGVIC